MKKNQAKNKKYEIDPFSSIPPVEKDTYDPFVGIGNLNPLNKNISADKTAVITEDKTADISAEHPRTIHGHSADKTEDISADTTEDKTVDKIKVISTDKTEDISKIISIDIAVSLTKKEAAFYEILQPYGSGITTAKDLSSLSGISKDYIIKLMGSLEKKGVIIKEQLNRQDKGYKFNIIQQTNIVFPENKKLIKPLSADKTEDKAIFLSADKTKDISTDKNCSYSSSSFYKKTTTTEFSEEGVIEKMLDHPELKFWVEQGITVKQILNGLKITDSTLDNFIQSMKHYAYEQPKSDKPPMAHLIGGIKRNGIWAKKPDYKSHEQKQIEIQNQIASEREQELKQLREVRIAAAKIQIDLEFEKFMADQNSALYRECFESLTGLEQKRVALGKDASMRRAWEKKIGL